MSAILINEGGPTIADNFIISGTTGKGFIELPNQLYAPNFSTGAVRLYSDSLSNISWVDQNGAVKSIKNTSTAARTWTLQDASYTIIGATTADTLINKTIDSSSNSLTVTNLSLTGRNINQLLDQDLRTTSSPTFISAYLSDSYVSGSVRSPIYQEALPGTGVTIRTDGTNRMIFPAGGPLVNNSANNILALDNAGNLCYRTDLSGNTNFINLGLNVTPTLGRLHILGGLIDTGTENNVIYAASSGSCTKITLECAATNGKKYEIRSANNGDFNVYDRTGLSSRFNINTSGAISIPGTLAVTGDSTFGALTATSASINGAQVTTNSNTQTLTNKTISSADNTILLNGISMGSLSKCGCISNATVGTGNTNITTAGAFVRANINSTSIATNDTILFTTPSPGAISYTGSGTVNVIISYSITARHSDISRIGAQVFNIRGTPTLLAMSQLSGYCGDSSGSKYYPACLSKQFTAINLQAPFSLALYVTNYDNTGNVVIMDYCINIFTVQ